METSSIKEETTERSHSALQDQEIVSLYWQRSEEAIPETIRKYGAYCHSIAMNILSNREDAEECVNDTWLGAWNSMPENRPAFLAPYLARLTRWLSLSTLKSRNRLKRGGGEATLALEELQHDLSSGTDPFDQIELQELSEIINAFIASLNSTERKIFLARYWYMSPISLISEKSGFSKSKVKSMLLRTRRRLHRTLEDAGLC